MTPEQAHELLTQVVNQTRALPQEVDMLREALFILKPKEEPKAQEVGVEERRRNSDEQYEKILERFSTLESRFVELNAKFDVYIAKQSANCLNHMKETEMICSKVAALSHTVNGNGEIGLVGKIDNLEKIDKDHKWNYKVIYTTIIGLVLATVWKLLIK